MVLRAIIATRGLVACCDTVRMSNSMIDMAPDALRMTNIRPLIYGEVREVRPCWEHHIVHIV